MEEDCIIYVVRDICLRLTEMSCGDALPKLWEHLGSRRLKLEKKRCMR